MKFMKRAGIYQCSNYKCTFDPKRVEAWSYRWWQFVKRIEGKTIFNDYRYSPTTQGHQRKVRELLETLGVKIDITLPVPQGLQKFDSLSEIIEAAETHLCDEFLREELKREERSAKARERRRLNKIKSQVEVYDNGGETLDRYTVVYLNEPEAKPETFAARGMCSQPFHPQGFGQMVTAMRGDHLGRRIRFEQLPKDCQKLVLQDLGVGGAQ
jgi:hypothetical protein